MTKIRIKALFTVVMLAGISSYASSANQHSGAGLSSLPAATQSSVSAALGRDISEYHVQATSDGLNAQNLRQKLAIHFTAEGVTVRKGKSTWGLALHGYGYGDDLKLVGAPSPRASLNRIEYRRGPLTEWYLNGPVGLEQGFTLSEPPAPVRAQPLTIELALSGNLKPTAQSGESLTLGNADGPALKYAGLTAQDANGQALRAWVEVQGDRLLLKVEDSIAAYPLVIDPWVQLAELTASDGAASDLLGSATDVSGNTVVVGAPNATVGSNSGQGATYIFVKPENGWQTTSNFTAKLTASGGLAGDAFGSAVSIGGSTIVVGACSQNGVCNNGPGKTYVYVEPPSGWATTSAFNAELTASDGQATDAFGNAVTVAGKTVLVAAPGATIGGNAGQGAVYVFVEPKGGWKSMTQTAKLTASDGQAGDNFGFGSLNSMGSIALVGSPFATVGANSQQGKAYIFLKPAKGWKSTTAFNAELTASDGEAGDFFGFCNFGGGCISANGKTAIIGAPQGGCCGSTGPGKAYVFIEPGEGWATTSQFTAELTASDGATGDNFGFSAAISANGSTVVIGAEAANTWQGAAYVFAKPKSGWETTSKFEAKLTASDGKPYSFFSYGGAAISGKTVAVGAAGAAVGSNADQGAAYVFGP
jgi:trimeric autotransporter adhesin